MATARSKAAPSPVLVAKMTPYSSASRATTASSADGGEPAAWLGSSVSARLNAASAAAAAGKSPLVTAGRRRSRMPRARESASVMAV